MLAADAVLIPVQPSPYDVWAAEEVVRLTGETRIYRDALQVAFVVSRRIVNTAIGRDVEQALSGWALPVLPAHVSQRVAFAETAAVGRAVVEMADSPARREVEALRDAILDFALASPGEGRGMSRKVVKIGGKPARADADRRAGAENWVRGEVDAERTVRMTVDMPADLHLRVRVACAMENRRMAEVIREILNERFPP